MSDLEILFCIFVISMSDLVNQMFGLANYKSSEFSNCVYEFAKSVWINWCIDWIT